MGGSNAPDGLALGRVTQVWLAVSDDAGAAVSGKCWHHQRTELPAAAVDDPAFRRRLLDELARLTDVELDGS